MADINTELIENQFSSFCCKVIKCAAVYFYRSEQRRHLHTVTEIPLSALNDADNIAFEKFYQDEVKRPLYIAALDMNVYVANDTLAAGLEKLPVIYRDILLMYYFLEMNDKNIGKHFGLYRQQIAYRRKKAIQLLYTLMNTGGQYDE
ncbi:MAG: hypothetical protein Q4G33_07720 [bacterium]|nr:hypothetical protein [bacterium]